MIKLGFCFLSTQHYLDFERENYPDYFQEIYNASLKLGRISSKKKMVVAIPVHSSENNLINVLKFYSNQTLSSDLFEICLFINRKPQDKDSIHLSKGISDFLNLHKLDITYFCKVFTKNITMGYIRKYLIDTILLRSDNPNLIIVNNDADTEYIEDTYLEEIYNLLENNPKLISYRESDLPNWILPKSMFHKLMLFDKMLEVGWNDYDEKYCPSRTFCYNIAFSTHCYAQNGGFYTLANIAEDITFSYCACRNFSKKQFIRTSSKLTTCYRRHIMTYLSGKPYFRAYGHFWETRLSNYDYPELVKLLIETDISTPTDRFGNEVNQYYRHFINERIPFYLSLDQNIFFTPILSAEETKELSIRISKELFSQSLSKMGLNYSITDINIDIHEN